MDQQNYNYLLHSQLSTVAGLDYNQVECLQRKRLLAFVNHFVSHTAHFLSNFTIQCEQRLDKINTKMNRLENELALLEFKLQSVPRLNDYIPTHTSEAYEIDTSPNASKKLLMNYMAYNCTRIVKNGGVLDE